MAEMQEYQAKSKGKSLLSHEDATLSDVNDLQNPPHIANTMKKKKKPALSELNLLDGELIIQSSSNLYDVHDMNYPREDYRSFGFH
ncbi:hypothetical protein Ahy_A10g047947 isoform A [Arachis hypogaea]|uniref:Uncharacterized protein n=1 Tax=Arachis hypogaea TaxID=3818 RepID=A0A445B3U9_ARAHY|nr:hypothetical protein Ahy_A10g047947 isoform A [Arachis hypogaea]